MAYFPLSNEQQSWLERAESIATDVLAPHAAQVDREADFPTQQLDALREAGLFGLRVDKDHGGQGEGLLTFALVTEALARPAPRPP